MITVAERWVLLAILLFGLAVCAILPPFEGYDEFAHVSYVEQLASTGLPPVYDSPISADINKLLDETTVAYSVDPQGPQGTQRHYDQLPHDAATLAAIDAALDTPPATPRTYAPGQGKNWQAQHPPLFYALTAPIWMATNGLSWHAQLFILRATAMLIAWSGLIAGMIVLRKNGQPRAARCLLWLPLFVPEFFPEFARYGNDSLCLLLAALTVGAALSYHRTQAPRALYALAVTLTLGLLTKAFFLPIGAGIGLWLLAYYGRRKEFWRSVISAALIVIAGGGAWYLYRQLHDGSLVGAMEFIQLTQRGGLWPNLAANFNLTALRHGIAAITASFAWAGTWSLVHIPFIFIIGLILPLVTIGVLYLRRLRRDWRDAVVALPAFALLPMAGGLFYHLLVVIALTGHAGTPGWYVLILSPLLALIAATADAPARLLRWAGVYAVLYTAASWICLLLLYGGVLTKDASNEFAATGVTLAQGWQQLATLGQPTLAAALLALAILAALFPLGMRARVS